MAVFPPGLMDELFSQLSPFIRFHLLLRWGYRISTNWDPIDPIILEAIESITKLDLKCFLSMGDDIRKLSALPFSPSPISTSATSPSANLPSSLVF